METLDKSLFENLIKKVINYQKSSNAHGRYKTCYTFPKFVVLKSKYDKKNTLLNPCKQQKEIAKLKQLGFKTPQLVFYQQKDNDVYEVQERATGKELFLHYKHVDKVGNLFFDTYTEKTGDYYLRKHNQKRLIEVLSAPNKQFGEFVINFLKGKKLGLLNDFHGQNVYYHKTNGFSFIDIPEIKQSRTLEEYQEFFSDLSDLEHFEWTGQNLMTAFNASWKDNSSWCFEQCYFNLIAHKFIEGIKSVKMPMPDDKKDELCQLFFMKISEFAPISVGHDYNNKLLLMALGKIEPNEQDSKILDFVSNKPLNINRFNDYRDKDKLDEKINSDLFLKCVDTLEIDGKPALDFYSQVTPPDYLLERTINKQENKQQRETLLEI